MGKKGGRLTRTLHLRLTDDELEFIEMISRKTGLTVSESARLAINMFRIILGLEAVDVDKVAKGINEVVRLARRYYEGDTVDREGSQG